MLCRAHDGETVTRPMLLKEVWTTMTRKTLPHGGFPHQEPADQIRRQRGRSKYIQTVCGTGYRLIAGREMKELQRIY